MQEKKVFLHMQAATLLTSFAALREQMLYLRQRPQAFPGHSEVFFIE